MATRKLTLVLDLDSGSFSTRVVDATGKLRTLDVAVNRTTTALNRADKAGQGFGSTMRQIHHSLSFVHVVMAAVTATVGGLTMGLVKVNAEAQRSITLLEGLSKGATQAARRVEAAADFKFIKEMSKNAPFSIAALTDSFVKLKSVGIDPTKGAMEALVNGLSQFGGTDDQFHRASIAIQQMMGKGVISMEELRQQLGEAFPTAIKVMARAAGMSVKDFVKQVSEGKVEAEKLLGTSGTFYTEMMRDSNGSAARMMQTFDGQVSVIKTKVRELAMTIGGFTPDGGFVAGGFMSELTKGAKDFSSWLSDPDTINGAKEFGKALTDMLVNLKDVVGMLVAAAPAIKMVGMAFLAWQGVRIAQTALLSLASAIGLTSGVTGQLTKASVANRIATTQATLAAVAGRDATNKKAEAVKKLASNNILAANDEIRSIDAKKAALATERAQVLANIAAYEKQAAASRAAAIASAQNGRAGFGNLVVGAGNVSGAKPAADALAAERALKANRTQLADVTRQLEQADTRRDQVTQSVTRNTDRLNMATKAASLSAGAARGSMMGLNAVMGLMGGPIMAGLLVSIGAVTAALTFLANKNQDYEMAADNAMASTKTLADVTADAAKYHRTAATAAGKQAISADDLTAAQNAAIGDTKGLSNALLIQTEQLRRNTIATIENARAKARADIQKLRSERASQAGIQAGISNVSPFAGYVYSRMNRGKNAARDVSSRLTEWNLDNQLKDAEEELKYWRETATSELASHDASNAAGAGTGSGSGSGGGDGKKGPGRRRESPAARLADEIKRLGASRGSIDNLITSMDDGTEAAEQMRAKIAEIRDDGGAISPAMEEAAIKAARDAHNLGEAYNQIKNVFSAARENSLSAADAMANLGMSTNKVDQATEQFARKMAVARAEILRLDPDLAKSAERMAILDKTIADSTADFKTAQIATSVRGLREEMEKLGFTSIDPNLQAWDAYAEKIAEITALEKQAADERDPAKRAQLMGDAAKSRELYTEDYLARLTYGLEEEIRANDEALMTTDQARQAAHEREVARIMAITDLSKLSAEDRAKYETQMLALRESALKSSAERLARDTETPMRRMVREYSDTTEQMKRLQGEWASDLMSRIKEGETNFGEFVIKMIEDYLWMIAQAKMAAMVEKGIDALVSIGTSMLTGGMNFSAGAGGTTSVGGIRGANSSFNGGGYYGGYHTGGIVGKEPTFFRNLSPAMFDGARRMHTGGIVGANEIPTILERGEGVFTQEQMKAMGGGAAGVSIEFNLINESGQELQGSEGGRSFDGEKYIIDVIVSNMNKPGPLRSAMGNR